MDSPVREVPAGVLLIAAVAFVHVFISRLVVGGPFPALMGTER